MYAIAKMINRLSLINGVYLQFGGESMADVNCAAWTCVNNIDGLCSARTINVLGNSATNAIETQCKTFAPREFISAVKNSTNLNLGGALAQMMQLGNHYDVKMTPSINCQAERCIYNEAGICGAKDIAISGNNPMTSKDTQCATFTNN